MQTFEPDSREIVDGANLESATSKNIVRVLHVDDDPTVLEISKQILMDMGNFEIDHACCVDEAFKKLSAEQYDVVISDYEMPLINGLDFLKQLNEQKRGIPFILFTGRGREDVAVKALNLGADSYINKNGSPETVYCELADAINKTVERRKTRNLLAMSDSKYRMLVERSLQGILIAQTNPLRIAYANAAMEKMMGFSIEEYTSLSPSEVAGLIYYEDRTTFFNRFKDRLEGKQADDSYEFRGVRKDGSMIWMEASATLIEYEGQPALQAGFLDINERKKTEDSVRKSEGRYRELANSLPDIVFETDLRGQLVFANKRAAEITGYSHRELEEGLNMMQFLAPEDRERALKNIQRLFTGENYVSTEYIFVRKDGTTFPALVTATPRISGNKLAGLRGLAIDITERKKIEQEFRDLAKFPSENPNPVLRVSKDNMVLYANQAAKSLLKGLNIEIGQPAPLFLIQPITAVLNSGSGQEIECEQNQRTLLFSIAPIKESSYVNVYGLDITERKKAEEELKIAASIFDLATDSILVHDLDGNIVNFNAAAYVLRGYSKEEMSKLNIHDFNSPESEKMIAPRIDKLLKNGSAVFEAVEVRKDKTLIPTEVHAGVVDLEGRKLIISVVRDIAERKAAEKKLKENSDRNDAMNEKLRVVGSLTRHDVRNKLSAVNGYTYLLKKKHRDQLDIVEGLAKIEKAVAESAQIFDFAKMYEQLGVEELTYVDMGKTVDEAVALFSGLTIKIVNNCHGTILLADSLLRQLFYNLIDNSKKHGQKTATITVCSQKEDSGGLRLIYEDDGVGISAENKTKLFTEGFSTGGSTGFGLFLIKKMMDVYGWQIQENGTPGEGAKFTITIPKLNKNGKENYQIAQSTIAKF